MLKDGKQLRKSREGKRIFLVACEQRDGSEGVCV